MGRGGGESNTNQEFAAPGEAKHFPFVPGAEEGGKGELWHFGGSNVLLFMGVSENWIFFSSVREVESSPTEASLIMRNRAKSPIHKGSDVVAKPGRTADSTTAPATDQCNTSLLAE